MVHAGTLDTVRSKSYIDAGISLEKNGFSSLTAGALWVDLFPDISRALSAAVIW